MSEFTVTQIEKDAPKGEPNSGGAMFPEASVRSYRTAEGSPPSQEQPTTKQEPPPAPASIPTEEPKPKPPIKKKASPKPQPQAPPPKKKPSQREKEPEEPENEDDEKGEDENYEEKEQEDEQGEDQGEFAESRIKGSVPKPVGFPKNWHKLPIDGYVANGFAIKRVKMGNGQPDQLYFAKGNEEHPVGPFYTQWYTFLIRIYPALVGNPEEWFKIIEDIQQGRWSFYPLRPTQLEITAYTNARQQMQAMENSLGQEIGMQTQQCDPATRAISNAMAYAPTPNLRGNIMKAESRIVPNIMIPKTLPLRKEVLWLYAWAVENKGYDKSLGDFMNDCTEAYMKDHGVEPMIYIGLIPDGYVQQQG